MSLRSPLIAFTLLLVALLTGGGIYLLLSPPPAMPAVPAPSPIETKTLEPVAPPSEPITKPAPTDPETLRQALYSQIFTAYGDYIEELRPSTHDKTVLEIRASRDDGSFFTPLANTLLQSNGKACAFQSATLLLPNPAGSVDRYRLAAEASADPQGRWNVFIR